MSSIYPVEQIPSTIRGACAAVCEQIAVWVGQPTPQPFHTDSLYFLGFPVGQATLGAQQRQVIEGITAAAQRVGSLAHPYIMAVRGRASAPGTASYNDELALQRAEAVYGAFVEAGWRADRLVPDQPEGLGEHHPLLEVGEAEHPVNRSVEVQLAYPDPFPEIDVSQLPADSRPADGFEINLYERTAASFRYVHFSLFHGYVRAVLPDGTIAEPRHLYLVVGGPGLNLGAFRFFGLPERAGQTAAQWFKKGLQRAYDLARGVGVSWSYSPAPAAALAPEDVNFAAVTVSNVPMSLAQLDGCSVQVNIPLAGSLGFASVGSLRIVFDPLGAAHEMQVFDTGPALGQDMAGVELLATGFGKAYLGGPWDPTDQTSFEVLLNLLVQE